MSVKNITDGFSKLNIQNQGDESFFGGPGYNSVINIGDTRQIFQTCSIGNEKTIPKNQVAYVIFAHGGWNKKTNPNQIVEPVENWTNLRFGTLVKNAGIILAGQPGTNHQQSVNRFIIGIMRGNIKIYQKYPWKQTNTRNETFGYFPNITFQEGGPQFRATIGKFYNGKVEFYKLAESANTANTNSPRLIPFMPSKQYQPVQTTQHISNNSCTLKNIMKVIHHDYHQNKTKYKINKINIIMATCLFKLPKKIQTIWSGNNPKYEVITGEVSKTTFAERKQKSLESKTRKSKLNKKSKTTFKIGTRKRYGTIQRGRIRKRKNKERRKLKKIQEKKQRQKTKKSKSKSNSNSLKRKTMRISRKSNKKRRLSY